MTETGRSRRLLALFAGFNAFWAWAGAAALLGGAIDFGELNERLPFENLVLAALALATIVAVPLTILAALAWRGDPRTGRVSVLVGVILVGWIALQLVFLRELSFFHPLYVVIGVVFIAAGRRAPEPPG